MEKMQSGQTFIVAELSANHNGRLDIAIETIRAAKRAGADSIKLQTYRADTITIDCQRDDFRTQDGSLWEGQYLYQLYEQAYTPWEWHEELFRVAKEEGLVCFSSPFDHTAVDLLESLGNPIYKIASFEITDIPLIRKCAQTGKPIVISTGVATEEDIQLAVDTCRAAGNSQITLLKCTSSYPAPIAGANLRMIPDLVERFGVPCGLSDHTMGHLVAVAAVALGAVMVEKHFILDRSVGGPDAEFSMSESEFAEMVKAIRDVELALGTVDYSLTEKKREARRFSRSLYVVEDIAEGEILTPQNVRSIRPGFSLHPKYTDQIMGMRAAHAMRKGDRLSFEDLE